MRGSRIAVIGVVAGAMVLGSAGAAVAAPTQIGNGGFDVDPVGSTSLTGWTTMNQLIDLGVTTVAGCLSQDTSTYTDLTDYANQFEDQVVVPPLDSNGIVLDTSGVGYWFDAAGNRVAANSVGAYALFYGEVDSDWEGETFRNFYFYDGSDYYIWEYAEEFTGDSDLSDAVEILIDSWRAAPDPTLRADDVPPATDGYFWNGDPLVFTTTVVDRTRDLQRDSNGDPEYDSNGDEIIAETPTSSPVVELFSDLNSDGDHVNGSGYVAHGPAVYSDVFTAATARTIRLDWAATSLSDDYHVLGYVQNVDTCEQIEVLDDEGESAAWSTASVNVPAGDYRFVFVSGSYDRTWGSAAGAAFYIDNIRSTAVISGTGLDLLPLFAAGDPAGNAPLELAGSGLAPNSPWSADLRSTPVTIATGTTDASGNFWQPANLPASVPAGRHTITLYGVNPDGSTRTDQAWVTVGANGRITYLSLTGAEVQLAATGVGLGGVGLAALLLGAGGALAIGGRVRSRRRSAEVTAAR